MTASSPSRSALHRSFSAVVPAALALVDAVSVAVSIPLAYVLRFEWRPSRHCFEQLLAILHVQAPKGALFAPYLEGIPFCVAVALVCFANFGLYRVQPEEERFTRPVQVAKALLFTLLLVLPITFLRREFLVSRLLGPMAVCIAAACSISGRALLSSGVSLLRRRGLFVRRTVILGDGPVATRVYALLSRGGRAGREFAGFVRSASRTSAPHDERAAPDRKTGADLDAAPSFASAEEALRNPDVDEIIVALDHPSREELVHIISLCDKHMKHFMVVPDIYDFLLTSMTVSHLREVPMLSVKPPALSGWNLALKRGFDIVVSAFLLVALSPLLCWLAWRVRRSSSGPIIFRQQRVGLDGREFTLYKFRSMRQDAEHGVGHSWAADQDARRTEFGAFMRDWSLDELPQLWNVLKGDMSLVGPRPEMSGMVEQFREVMPRYMSRHRVKSGITGLAQIAGLRGNTPLSERIECDLRYIEHWSFFTDLRILCMTVFHIRNPY